MIESKKSEFDCAVSPVIRFIPELAGISAEIKSMAREVRIRAGRPTVICCAGYDRILQGVADAKTVESCVSAFCESSIHSYEKELAQGYITLKGGHRAGFCGTAVYTDDKVSLIKNISSINIRIARQHIGCADKLSEIFNEDELVKGLLIIGKPLSGKTTVLRDLCRTLGSFYKLALIDERDEIAAVHDGVPQLDVGLNTDVFSGFYKNDGMIRAIRCMSPDYVVTDELGSDFSLIKQCMNSGVGLIMTAHCDSEAEMYRNRDIARLLDSGAISHIVRLTLDKYGIKQQIIKRNISDMRVSV
ncbi:MAG: hypothetical protein J1E39_00375 [Eubacterium sp.]|nr:hypothetical protein [Eubacterium sp.]